MSFVRLLIRNVFFFWRTHLAVLLGVVIASAVIGGALIVGDSIRASLIDLTLKRLGDVDYAVSSPMFFTQELADRLQDSIDGVVAPALTVRGGVTRATSDGVLRVGSVNIIGTERRLWALLETRDVPLPENGQVVLNSRVASELKLKVGDQIALNVEIPSAIPRESLLGERDDLSRELSLTVSAVFKDTDGADRFGLNPSQQIPLIAYVSLADLQNALEIAEQPASRRNPIAKSARINSLYVSDPNSTDSSSALDRSDVLTDTLRQVWNLDDLELRLISVSDRGYVSLESEQMILSNPVVAAGRQAATELKALTSPVNVYLVNELVPKTRPDHYAMYSVIAGVDFDRVTGPFGPFRYLEGGPPQADNEIVLNEFVATEQLRAKVGDELELKYYTVGSDGDLPELTQTFFVSGIVSMEDSSAGDRHLTPSLEGITDAETFQDWDQPFAMDLDRITAQDDAYWEEYRATPKAFIRLNRAQELFGSRYGALTSFRTAPANNGALEPFAQQFEEKLLAAMDPRTVGMTVQPVRWQGLQAASGTTDFAGLFIGFSLFIIISAAILVGLLVRLGVEQRVREIGIESAVGLQPRQILRWMFAESMCVVLIGTLLGCLAGIGYAALMIWGLTTWWRGAIGTRFLHVSVEPISVLLGLVITLVVAAISAWIGLRGMRKISARGLLSGETRPDTHANKISGPWLSWAALVTVVTALILIGMGLVGLIPTTEAFGGFSWQVVSFFAAGFMLLLGLVLCSSVWLGRSKRSDVRRRLLLGMRNAAREHRRSVLTIALIACATFLLVAVAASRKDPAAETPERDSGNGGFLLLGECTTPLPYDLSTEQSRKELGLLATDDPKKWEIIQNTQSMAFRVRPGDDASCLNLYQTGLPTVLGVPERMIQRGGFRFNSTPGENPWETLRESLPPTNVAKREIPTIPILADANTLMYSLKKGIGDTILVPNEHAPEYALKVMGMFDGSVFQGMLLMSEKNFLQRYPEIDGYGFFLFDAPVKSQDDLTQMLESELTPYGFDVESVGARIAEFLVVQNTYLSAFGTLGGLGLLLGTFGLGAVMLRNIVERRSEFALMRGIGFRKSQLSGMVLIESAVLLGWGLFIGACSALLALAPHLSSQGAQTPWGAGIAMLAAVLLAGLLSSWFAARAAVRTPIVAALRGE